MTSASALRGEGVGNISNFCGQTELIGCVNRRWGRVSKSQNFADIICESPPPQFPFMVLLGIEPYAEPGKIRYYCGGSLINRYYVLTAAHCARSFGAVREVVLEENTITEDPECLDLASRGSSIQVNVSYTQIDGDWISTPCSQRQGTLHK